MVKTSRYLGPNFNKHRPNGCTCSEPAPGSKDRRKQFRIAKRKADREAMRNAEQDLVDEWAEMEELQRAYDMVDAGNDWHWEDLQQEDYREDLQQKDYDGSCYWHDDYDGSCYDYDYEMEHRCYDQYDRQSYPPGAINSIEVLAEQSWVYVASRKYHTVYDKKLSGDITLSEMTDYNVINLNGYNDWFVFDDHDQAKDWAQV